MVAFASALKNPLGSLLAQEIDRSGFISIETFHRKSLYDPRYGYYQKGDVLGLRGDFVTAPEVSSLFGEIVGAWLLNMWEQMGAPTPIQILELGPGRGLMMSDMLRVAQCRSSFLNNVSIHFIEVHPKLQEQQRRNLKRWEMDVNALVWHQSLDTFTSGPGCLFVIANEFFDALPACQYVKAEKGWNERCVTCDDRGAFCFATRPGPLSLNVPNDYPVGAIFEESPQTQAIFKRIVTEIKACGGAAFVCDYGYSEPSYKESGFTGDSWQALRRGEPVSPLCSPGESDLSFHVNFGVLADIARVMAEDVRVATQGDFLNAHGLQQRLEILLKKATPQQAARLRGEVMRLSHPLQMGALFKVLTFSISPRKELSCDL